MNDFWYPNEDVTQALLDGGLALSPEDILIEIEEQLEAGEITVDEAAAKLDRY